MNDAGELKHGTIALIEEHQPVIALCCNEDIMEKNDEQYRRGKNKRGISV